MTPMDDPFKNPHRRFNPLTGEWILVSPHRLLRPWQGKVEDLPPDNRPAHDPQCYLCPGNKRAGDDVNPDYKATYVFQNDFAALKPEEPSGQIPTNDLFRAETERGICRVICFSPRHDLTLAEMEPGGIENVIRLWQEQYRELGALDYINYVQIFENKGAIMGCSNPHPHGQVWATGSVPFESQREDQRQVEYYASQGRTLLQDYLAEELRRDERVVCANDSWAAVVPFWAKWPFETLLAPLRPVASMDDLTADDEKALADVLKRLTVRYDNLFKVSFPYTMGFHQAPTDGGRHPHWHMHAHFYPPLLRSATVQKFMVGFEMLAMPQRDITPELAAQQLKALPEIHYKQAATAPSNQ